MSATAQAMHDAMFGTAGQPQFKVITGMTDIISAKRSNSGKQKSKIPSPTKIGSSHNVTPQLAAGKFNDNRNNSMARSNSPAKEENTGVGNAKNSSPNRAVGSFAGNNNRN